MAATGNEIVILSQLKWFKENVVAGMVSQTIAEEASEREKQDGLLEDQIVAKIGPSNIKAGTGISVSQSGNDVTVTSTVRDTNTTYTLSKSGSTIKLTGSDGSSTTVTDADTKYTLPAATGTVLGGVKVGSGISVSSGTISTSLSNLGVTATAAELNYMDGVTSNVQTQLNSKAASTHKHAAADISSGTLSVDRLPTIPLSKGGTGATSAATARTALGVQNPITAANELTNQNLNSYNSLQHCGWYYAKGGNSVTNKPSGVDAFGMFIMRTAWGLYTQFLYDSNKLWTRTYSNSSWSSWTALVRTTDTIAKAASATNATNATKATQDSAGQQINTTYVKSVTASGRTVTVTKGDGKTSTFQTQDTTYSNMGGASTSAAGRAGLVPAPSQGNANRYLRSDGTWQVPPDTNTTYSAATTSTAGLMSSSDKTKLDGIASGANKTTVDTALSSTSTNPVQNKVINSALAGKAASSHTHPASQVTGLTANRALISDGNGHPAVSTVTSTELGYLDGVTSNIQSQLNGKAASSHNHAASQITSGTLSADRIPTLSPTKVASDPVFIVNAASDSRSISGKKVVKPCILVVTGTNPPQIIYDDGK